MNKVNKKLTHELSLKIPAQAAGMGPPLATSLGPKIALGVFVKEFNDNTKQYDKGADLRVALKIFADRTYEMTILGYTTGYLLQKAAGITKGSGKAGHDSVGKIVTNEQIKEIAQQQEASMGYPGLLSAITSVEATAKSMGITIE